MGIILDYVIESTSQYMECMPKEQRKAYGQFFTSKETAQFMASLFNVPANNAEIAILDLGAGSGILSAALIERLQSISHLQKINLTCYETDVNIVDLLKQNLEWIGHQSRIKVGYRIVTDNFILSQSLEYNHMISADSAPIKYDIVIGNPPYKKIAKESPEAIFAMAHLIYIFYLRQWGSLI